MIRYGGATARGLGFIRLRRVLEISAGSQPIRVLYYSHSGDVSGAEISLLLTISHMSSKVDGTLVAPQGELITRARQQGIPVKPVTSYRARMSSNPLILIKGVFGTLRAGLELRHMIRTYKSDILHANSIRAGLISVIGVLGTPTRLIWHVRDNLPSNMVGRGIRAVAAWRVHRLFAISEAIRTNFADSNRLQKKTAVVHNGINIGPENGRSIRSELGTPPNRFVVAVVGQIALWKHQHDAITAFADLHRQFPNSELWIVGEPKFREENMDYLEQLRGMARALGMADIIRFLGFRADVMNVMESIDVLLVPSENEPFGRVVIEAMLAGKPVIGTRGGGIPEIVMDGKTGYLVETEDTVGMTSCLSELYRDRVAARRMGLRGRDRVHQAFSIQSKVEQMHAIYREQLNKEERRLGT